MSSTGSQSPAGSESPAEPETSRYSSVTGDDLAQPFIAVTATVLTAMQLPRAHLVAPFLAVPLFVVVAACSFAAILSWSRLSHRTQIAIAGGYAVLAAVLLPLAHNTVAPFFAYSAAATAGAKLATRRAAVGVAVAGAVSAATTVWIAERLSPSPDYWPWWLALTVGMPVYMGISKRDRREALASARRAAAEAQRATESEARTAALMERGRIAREIHDVLGHSLSGIALQLDMADALSQKDRGEEALAAVRRARALAVDSIAETRHAVHALREDTLPLQETLRLMAESEEVAFDVLGEPAPVSVETAQTALRVAQEALTNAMKYAPGAARAMTLEFTADAVSLTVANGPSRSPGPRPGAEGTGMGLVGMRERAALVGGTLRAGPDLDNTALGNAALGDTAPGNAGSDNIALKDTAQGGWTVKLEVPR
ncbi:histidine kinase [Streptomyces sp. NPDC050617]|uniref:sensor histidine kinase n=1 Tax=Streptomyces sp. NPDC050617 TaxID=3154628 RepID=UPI00343B3DA1